MTCRCDDVASVVLQRVGSARREGGRCGLRQRRTRGPAQRAAAEPGQRPFARCLLAPAAPRKRVGWGPRPPAGAPPRSRTASASRSSALSTAPWRCSASRWCGSAIREASSRTAEAAASISGACRLCMRKAMSSERARVEPELTRLDDDTASRWPGRSKWPSRALNESMFSRPDGAAPARASASTSRPADEASCCIP